MTIYLDENFPPALARALEILQNASGESPLPVEHIGEQFRGMADEEWLPQLASAAVVITQDKHIHRARNKREIYRQEDVVLVVVRPPKKKGLRYWEMVSILIRHWEEIKAAGRGVRPAAHEVGIRSGKLRPL